MRVLELSVSLLMALGETLCVLLVSVGDSVG